MVVEDIDLDCSFTQRCEEDATSNDSKNQLSDPFKNMSLMSQQVPPPMFAESASWNQQENADPKTNLLSTVRPPLFSFSQRKTQHASQFMSQDFVTPADQFDVDNDVMNCSQRPAGTLVRQRSPAAMSPMRMKRVNRMNSPGPSAFKPKQKPRPAPCYRNAFSGCEVEEKCMMSWQTRQADSEGGVTSTGSRYRDDFKETGMLGQGTFCKVYSARHKLDGKVYAIKRTLRGVKRQSSEFAQFLQEVQILSNIPYHPGIIRYYTSWTESSTDCYDTEKLFIQLEAGSSTIKNLSLGDPLPEKALRVVARQLLLGLEHLHMHGIAHMDVKPSNIIIVREDDGAGQDRDMFSFEDGEIKLGDFGLATACRPLKGHKTQELAIQEGDACYLPLEVMNSNYAHLDKADVFALGATLFELASGNELPSGGQLYEDLRREKVPLLPNVTNSLMQMIRSMMKREPSQRPSCAQLLEKLSQ
jgi:wee1-like protein kinase